MWLRFFSLTSQCCSAPASAWVLNPLKLGELGLEEGKKKGIQCSSQPLGKWSRWKKNLSKRKNTFPVDQFLDPVCQAQELVLTQRRAGTQAGRRMSTASFGGIVRLNACHRKHLHCFWGLQLVGMVQISENFCLQGQTSPLDPLDTSSGSSVWKWLEQINHTEFFFFCMYLKNLELLQIKSGLTVVSGTCLSSWKQCIKDREKERN